MVLPLATLVLTCKHVVTREHTHMRHVLSQDRKTGRPTLLFHPVVVEAFLGGLHAKILLVYESH